MATSPKQTILIVHGGWLVPQSYAKLTAALEASNFEVHIPRLPSVKDVRPPEGDLSTDTEVIRKYAEDLLKDGRTIVALLHSYGGQVGSNALHDFGVKARAAKGLPGGVSHLIYMTAYAVLEGTSMMDKVKHFDNMNLVPLAFDIREDNSVLSRDPKLLLVSPEPGDDEKEVEEFIGTFQPWNAKCMYDIIQHAAWRSIPASFIYTTKDMTVPIHYQQHFVETLEKEGHSVQTFELQTGHCPNFTATEKVMDFVKEVVSG
ncbi:Alpha/beta hydrolase fold-1 [Xylariaceae sp. FL1272]|nr:Alpha/beta hydrolase fold-1 [Xylariaceae sp. FL1272]